MRGADLGWRTGPERADWVEEGYHSQQQAEGARGGLVWGGIVQNDQWWQNGQKGCQIGQGRPKVASAELKCADPNGQKGKGGGGGGRSKKGLQWQWPGQWQNWQKKSDTAQGSSTHNTQHAQNTPLWLVRAHRQTRKGPGRVEMGWNSRKGPNGHKLETAKEATGSEMLPPGSLVIGNWHHPGQIWGLQAHVYTSPLLGHMEASGHIRETCVLDWPQIPNLTSVIGRQLEQIIKTRSILRPEWEKRAHNCCCPTFSKFLLGGHLHPHGTCMSRKPLSRDA